MGSEVFLHQFESLAYPFIDNCEGHKLQFLCKIPDCKNCLDYVQKVKNLKLNALI